MATILHVDMDAFFAAVEILDRPSLSHVPLAVGGDHPSGIVATASYAARKYGIHSAMPMFMAKSLCPDLVVVPARKGRYSEKSREVFAILASYGYPLEQVSIDEAYLDLTKEERPVPTARAMQERVRKETGLSMSCGLSYNKFLAKLASDMDKPAGFTVIERKDAPAILAALPVGKIHGIGEKTEEKLHHLGIHTGADLKALEREFLEREFGKSGRLLYERIRGIDRRKVETERKRKSIGCEETFRGNRDRDFFVEKLAAYSRETAENMEKKGFAGAYTVTVKIKTADFEIHTKSRTFERPVVGADALYDAASTLFFSLYEGEKLRLLGLSASNLVQTATRQLRFL